jgi:hypothetical protein
MDDHSTLDIDLNELIFADKNREYGAYILRKSYERYLTLSLWFVVGVFIITISGPLIYSLISNEKDNTIYTRRIVEVVELSQPPSIDETKQVKPADVNPLPKTADKFTSPIVKPDELVNNDLFWNADTVSLQNIYNEGTLEVEIKYPSGWTYLDQNAKNRLDGVTFWGSTNLYNPPPYIHLEVMDKYLFNPAKFKYKSEFENYIIYYNDPGELSGQITRLLYIRTETDVDYVLKLIMKGKEQFENFEPVFFGMVKSFSFGD